MTKLPEPFWREVMRALAHNAGLYAHDHPHIDEVLLKRELRKDIKAARKVLAITAQEPEPRIKFANGRSYPMTAEGFDDARLNDPNPMIRGLMESFKETAEEVEKRAAQQLNDMNLLRDFEKNSGA